MNQKYNPALKIISTIVLSFFLWTFGGVFEVAYAVKESGQKSESRSQKGNITPPGLPLPQVEGKRPEEKFGKAIEDIDDILKDDKADHETKKQRIKAKKSEIEGHDSELRKQFADTEAKIKDLPDVIKKRHRDFVKHYESNLLELKTNLEDIDKAKVKAEVEVKVEKAKKHLEKTRPPKRHKPLDPNKLPHRTPDVEHKEPRTKPEEFEQDRSQNSVVRSQKIEHDVIGMMSFPLVGNLSEERLRLPNSRSDGAATHWAQASRRDKGSKPILLAMNGEPTGLLSPNSQYLTQNSELSTQNYLQLALANPPTTADLAETIEVKFTSAITAKAAELQYKPVKIYDWVRNNIEYVPTYGSIQGADMCLQTKLCNDFDTASLLIALLRASGIHARYVYGTIELPVEKVKNWAGGFTDSNAALSLMATGGIPVGGITEGGKIVTVRKEHIWVEAFIDYFPMRGIRHKTGEGDTWIPLDASFKQYTYTSGIDIKSAVPFDAQTFVSQIQATATINEQAGYVTNVNSLYIQQTMQDYQSRVQSHISQNYPNATVGDVLGKKEIIKQEFPYLLGTLPYKKVVTGTKYSTLPDSFRHKASFSMLVNNLDYEMQLTKSLPELAGKKITLSYSPATQADENVINSYLPKPHADGTPIQPNELPSSLPAYLIKLKPELRIDGVVIATGSPITMGQDEFFNISLSAPKTATHSISNKVTAGEFNAIALDIARITPEQMSALKTKLEATKAKLETQNFTGLTKDDILGDLLYTTVLSYFAELDTMDFVTARTMGVFSTRLPSAGRFFNALSVDYIWGVPVRTSTSGLSMDIGLIRKLVKAPDGSKEKQIQFMLSSGMKSSALEHSVPEQLFSTSDNPVQGISAVKALQIANDQGIPIFKIDQSNIGAILPQLQLSPETITDIQNAVGAGKTVTVSKTNIAFNGWTGCGYIIIDPNTGAGAYMVSTGTNGAVILITALALLVLGVIAAVTIGPWILAVVAILLPLYMGLQSWLMAQTTQDKYEKFLDCFTDAVAAHIIFDTVALSLLSLTKIIIKLVEVGNLIMMTILVVHIGECIYESFSE